MVAKGSAVCLALVTLAMVGQWCNAQHEKPAKNQPQKSPLLQSLVTESPIHWSYPIVPPDSPKIVGPPVIRAPVGTNAVQIDCKESVIEVRVKTSFYGGGELNGPFELTLGTCQAVGYEDHSQSLIFISALEGCESHLQTTDDYLVYSFRLSYNPTTTETVVFRAVSLEMLLECHYPKRHSVSSLPLDPVYVPYSAIKVSGEYLYFSLELMTEDWQYQRSSRQYAISEMMYFEATVQQFMHVPLRVFVDYCVASTTRGSPPEYVFIDDYGCFVDAKITGSSSMFLPRANDNILRFQMPAFRLHGDNEGLMYLTCHLKATTVAVPIGQRNRACSWLARGWSEASGVDGACSSCGGVTGGGHGPSDTKRNSRSLTEAQSEVDVWETTITLDPIQVSARV